MSGLKTSLRKNNSNPPLASVITPVLNAKRFIGANILSVTNQSYAEIEHIIIDGGSTDGTLEVIKKHQDKIAKFISEKDRGIYDAMNKGIKQAQGEIVGILNADDFYAHNRVLEMVVKKLEKKDADICWGDLVYVKKDDPDKIVRYWQSSPYKEGLFASGWVPPHPCVFVRKQVYQKYGKYRLDFPIAGDYEWLLRVLKKYRVQSCYIPQILVKMRWGGKSNKSIKNIIKGNRDIYRAWRMNGLSFPPLFYLKKVGRKLLQFYNKNRLS